ncbi:dnaK protein [Trichomonas vaginalis G3]|uniref:DnaK protein n=1 Tax=Trichomonas vaginalis (strain ATCC PRA-98 / G3) TaxID=412133 RepID=A2DKY9_TRIV3|nr:ATP binding [Trichomonas vaginalis G3]EAY18942.1 dnaK protein [Trichomonas vaginalis G3]KAI5532008.1 ATP binding [Trichomonas vaginalis G3]|eukprot:XP_001579928.1 dnaK protein [Trichomonas vaginalis G3]
MLSIDLGISNIIVCTVAGNRIGMNDIQYLPSYVMIGEDGSVTCGAAAKDKIAYNPSRVIFGAKRLIGHKYHDRSVQELLENVDFEIQAYEDDNPIIVVDGKKYMPEEIISFLLEHVKETCKNTAGNVIADCVSTVPANFNDAQRNATIAAARMANLNVHKLLSEPTAAAIAYCSFERRNQIHLLVFDFGASKLDVSIVYVDGQVFNVKAIATNSNLGGANIDNIIVDYCIEQFKKNHSDFNPKDPKNRNVMACLLKAAEEAKMVLSSLYVTDFTIPNFYDCEVLDVKLRRNTFHNLIEPILDEIPIQIHSALKAAGLKPHDIDDLLLVGGSSLIPDVKEKIEEIFPEKIHSILQPFEAISRGAATICWLFLNNQIPNFDVIRENIGQIVESP